MSRLEKLIEKLCPCVQRDGGAVHVDSEHLPEESHRKLADLIYELIVYEG